MANKRSISTMRPTPSEKQRGPQSLPLRMENFGGAGKPESSKHFSAEIAAFASLWSVILGKRGLVFNSLTFSCYLASILCKNAEMPHFRAAFLLCIFFINTFCLVLTKKIQACIRCTTMISEKFSAYRNGRSILNSPGKTIPNTLTNSRTV